jgi:hypothetical protein
LLKKFLKFILASILPPSKKDFCLNRSPSAKPIWVGNEPKGRYAPLDSSITMRDWKWARKSKTTTHSARRKRHLPKESLVEFKRRKWGLKNKSRTRALLNDFPHLKQDPSSEG